LKIPTIGIGAGAGCDGQILVTDDLLGKYTDFLPRFVRRYANLAEVCEQAIHHYSEDVRSGDFPNAAESFALSDEEEEKLKELRRMAGYSEAEISC
jgi:3-methyl-2-oxobutanoate hydroxymethyltransferase